MYPASALQPHRAPKPWTRDCEACKGIGKLWRLAPQPGAALPRSEAITCGDCRGEGWLLNPAFSGPCMTHGLAVPTVSTYRKLPEYVPCPDCWVADAPPETQARIDALMKGWRIHDLEGRAPDLVLETGETLFVVPTMWWEGYENGTCAWGVALCWAHIIP